MKNKCLQQEHNAKFNENDKLQNELSREENILQNLTTDIKEIRNQHAHAEKEKKDIE